MEAEHWHLSKSITISTIFSIVALLSFQVFTYGQNQEKLDNLQIQVNTIINGSVQKSTVEQMFQIKDVQIKALTNQVQDVKANVKENKLLLQQILREMPRSGN